jgi:hypothetical protein
MRILSKAPPTRSSPLPMAIRHEGVHAGTNRDEKSAPASDLEFDFCGR